MSEEFSSADVAAAVEKAEAGDLARSPAASPHSQRKSQ